LVQCSHPAPNPVRRGKRTSLPQRKTPSLVHTRYDKNGNRVSLKDPRGKISSADYDALNRLKSETTPAATYDGCPTGCAVNASYTYTLDNLQANATDFNGSTTSFSFDAARRLKLIDYPGVTSDVEHSYDKAGSRLSMKENGVQTAVWTYDELNRVLTATTDPGPNQKVVTYTYDRRDLVGLKYPDNKQLTYSYSALGQLTTLDDWRGSASGRSTFSYYDDGRKKDQTLPNGAFSSWEYNTAGWLKKVEHKTSPTGSVFTRFEYPQYDLAGNRETEIDFDGSTSQTKTFTYDALHRLKTEAFAGTTTTYNYDEAGNRSSKVVGASTTTYVYDDDNRLLSLTDASGATLFGYDKNGSITSKTVPVVGTTSYSYDAARRLTTVFPASGSQISLAYDGSGARKSKTNGSGTATYVNDTRGLTQVLQETLGTNTITQVPGILQHDALQAEPFAYFHGDHQNNRVLTGTAATVTKRWEFDPFGGIRSETGSGSSDFQFAGEQKDADTGLINLRARYYDPVVGRLISRDVLSGVAGFPQTFNRYAYASNNPLRFIDPSGYEDCESIDGSLNDCHDQQPSPGDPGQNPPPPDDEDDCQDNEGEVVDDDECDDQTLAREYLIQRAYEHCLNNPRASGCHALIGNFELAHEYLLVNDADYRYAVAWSDPLAVAGGAAALAGEQAEPYRTSAADVNAASVAGRLLSACANSFDAVTPVETDVGPRHIADVREGDRVLAWNEAAGQLGYNRVTATWHHLDPVVVTLWIDGERLLTTPEHPFFVEERGWMPAGNLGVGSHIRKADGATGTVERVEREARARAMYNLTVERAHTFFVGQQRLLVHNADCYDLARAAWELHRSLDEPLRASVIAAARNADGEFVYAVYHQDVRLQAAMVAEMQRRGLNVLAAPTGRGPSFHAERQLDASGYTQIGISRKGGMCGYCIRYFRSRPNTTVVWPG
jgi:RHS repeat-associated protein